jgi:hypothetical protein
VVESRVEARRRLLIHMSECRRCATRWQGHTLGRPENGC